ncbi:hypothetical protein TrRE_jg2914 [Triparma retinervis]|uniref:V-type proton ATPase proteolipid subunit n=1 Tax=Triparma retinervis TaxID=2557542 RepID=A0A9W7EA10_9STRA|nr:hypothetical protein TrRE_jg2914 [Triparma retinervis]
MGAMLCIVLSNLGAAIGTHKCGIGVSSMGIKHPGGIIKNLIGVIMAGVLGIFGLIVAIILGSSVSQPTIDGETTYSEYNGWRDLCAGLCCGMTCLAAGWSTGVAGEHCIKATGIRAQVNAIKSKSSTEEGEEGDAAKLYIAGVTILSFAGALGLYGFIVSLILASSQGYSCNV